MKEELERVCPWIAENDGERLRIVNMNLNSSGKAAAMR
jgi:hypothetical protein